MHAVKTIVATTVVTLAATAVAYAGVNGVGDKSSAAQAPVKAVVAHQHQAGVGNEPRLTERQKAQVASVTKAKTERKHERHVAQQKNAVKSANQSCDQTRDQTRDRDHAGTCDQTCDQARDQTRDRDRDQTGDQSGDQVRERAGSGTGACGGCGD